MWLMLYIIKMEDLNVDAMIEEVNKEVAEVLREGEVMLKTEDGINTEDVRTENKEAQ